MENVQHMFVQNFQQNQQSPTQESLNFSNFSYNQQHPVTNATGTHLYRASVNRQAGTCSTTVGFDSLVEASNWNLAGNSTAPATASTALNVAAASADNAPKNNKVFSLIEVNSGEYMHVEIPQFSKHDLTDVELLQYQVI